MEILSAVVPFLVLCSLEYISARNLQASKFNVENWLDITIEELVNQCKMKDKEDKFHEVMSEYDTKQDKFLKPMEQQDIGESDYTWHYIYNTDMINTMKKLMKVLQECLDEEKRLDSEGIVTVMARVLKEKAMKVAKIDPISQEDSNCLKSKHLERSSCSHIFPSGSQDTKRKLLDLLIFEIIANSNCEQNLPYINCAIDEIKDCSPKAKKFVKIALSPAEVPVCDNYLQEAVSETKEQISNLLPENEKLASSSVDRYCIITGTCAIRVG